MARVKLQGIPTLGLPSVLLGLATGATLALLALPPTPWLASALAPLTTALSAGWLAWRGLLWLTTYRERQSWRCTPAWELAPETLPPPTTGVYLGQAFAWDGTHTQALEMAQAVDGRLPVGQDARGGHPVLHAVGKGKERSLVLPWSELGGHVSLTGTTGSGKTRSLEVLASQVIQAPGATVIIDPKGARTFLARCAAEARRADKPFALITPAFPQQSASINLLASATTPAEVSARIAALMPPGARDPFFREYPLALIERIAGAQQAMGHPWTLEGLYRPAVLYADLAQLTLDYLAHLGFPSPRQDWKEARNAYRKASHADLTADGLLDDLEHDRDHLQKVTANLIPAFRGVVGAPLGPIFSQVQADVTWERIAREEMVVYIALASMLIGDIANRIGRVILQDFIGYLGRRYAYEDLATTTPITMIVDEVARVAYPQFPTALAMSREANARFIIAGQSLADMEAALGEKALARQIYENCNTRVYLRVTDETAEQATEGLGLCTVLLPETGTSIGYGGVGGLSGSTTRRLAPRETLLIRPSWLAALPRGEAYIRMKGEVHKLRMPLLTPVSVAMLDELGLSAMWKQLEPVLKETLCPTDSQP